MMTKVEGMFGHVKLIAGTACPGLAREIAAYLTTQCPREVSLLEREIMTFDNGNIYVRLTESVRGQDVYIIQTMAHPVNNSIMELLITLDTVRRDSAGRITAVIPYYAYSRSDKKDIPRTPITARLLADMIQVAGADRYMTIDLHAGQIQGFFTIPGDHLTARYLLCDYVSQHLDLEDLVVVTVDLGFAKGGRNWAHGLGVPLALIEKERIGTEADALSLVGTVEGKNVLLVDDEVDTAGSLHKAVKLLKKRGAKKITVAFTHAVFSGKAQRRLEKMQDKVDEFVFTNTLPVSESKLLPNMTILSVADLLGEVIRRSHLGVSVGEMFDE
jgi:ribose-phosphate pyrophosphokinase